MPKIAALGGLSSRGFGEFNQGQEKLYVEDVFSTWLYTGNGGTQTITNGIDLAGKGGMVWVKGRVSGQYHMIWDTNGGAYPTVGYLTSNSQNSRTTSSDITDAANYGRLTNFNSNGFSLGAASIQDNMNASTVSYVSWTFRKAAKYFDVVTWVGNGANRTISHSLGAVPGMILVKRTDTISNWQVYHRSLSNTEYMLLDKTDAKATGATRWNSTTPTAASFSLGTDATVNKSGGTYVAYLFAHDAGGFGADGSQNVISCGSYTGNGSATGPTITLGWEPQWLLVKRADSTANWYMYDNMRGMFVGTGDLTLFPNLADAETSANFVDPLSTGFSITATSVNINASGGTYIYLAIRRGPMRTPTSGTSVFLPITANASSGAVQTTNFVIDSQWKFQRSITDALNTSVDDRLRGVSTTTTPSGRYLITSSTSAEATTNSTTQSWNNTGFQIATYYSAISSVFWNFRRAPGFFDVVAYGPGNSTNLTVNHNLGVLPELIITKSRNAGSQWIIQNGSTNYGFFNSNAFTAGSYWTTVTSTSISRTVDGNTYIAYLFASCPGVSKVGSYTGTGTTQQINCGFTAGARFVLIKRTDSTGDWWVYDSARGIVAGNDPYLFLNSTAAEVTSTDYVDAYAAGFELSSTAPAGLNANGGTYIFLAIA